MDIETLRNLLGDAYGRLILINHPDTTKEQRQLFLQMIDKCKTEFVKKTDAEISSIAQKTDWTKREELEKLIKKVKLTG